MMCCTGTEDLNVCIFCFVTAAIGACIFVTDDVVSLALFAIGFIIVAGGVRLVAWMQDKLYQILGGKP